MALGKEVGEYSHKFTSFTLTPGPAGSIVIQGNCEGGATGYGTIISTLSAVGGKSGTLSWCGAMSLDNGDQLTGIGSGTYESSGKNRWRTQLLVQISDGRTVLGEGEVDLASRSWSGKMFERS